MQDFFQFYSYILWGSIFHALFGPLLTKGCPSPRITILNLLICILDTFYTFLTLHIHYNSSAPGSDLATYWTQGVANQAAPPP